MLIALKGYTPPAPPDPPPDLTEVQKDKVKNYVRNLLASGPMESKSVVLRVMAKAASLGVTVSPSMVLGVLTEMGAAGEFEPGYGPQPAE